MMTVLSLSCTGAERGERNSTVSPLRYILDHQIYGYRRGGCNRVSGNPHWCRRLGTTCGTHHNDLVDYETSPAR